MRTLHILNGEATSNIFRETGIDGDVLVWNEILSEGPVSKDNTLEMRAKWFLDTFNEPLSKYREKIVDEIKKLQNLAQYHRVILWFEFDLVCQINLIYLLSLLNKLPEADRLLFFLICPEKVEGFPNFRGLGELSPQQLLALYDSKVLLEEKDFVLAEKAWEVYVDNDYNRISDFLEQDLGNLHLLGPALRAHLLRFPNPNTQLNHIEEVLLSLLDTGISTRGQIYEAFCQREPIYGITDLQLGLVLDQLKAKGLAAI